MTLKYLLSFLCWLSKSIDADIVMLLMVVIIILLLIIFLITFWICRKISRGRCEFCGHLVGKVVIVTGANSGIGFETARNLAERGARVILACRNLERGTNAKQKIINTSGNSDVHFFELDLESLKSIRKFVDNILKSQERLDVLINNAGIYSTDNRKTEDGLLMAMQINYFGPFLLTLLLLPLLRESVPSRIINVSSFLYVDGRIDFENLNLERRFSSYKAYSNAKLCIMLMTAELDRRLRGTGVTVNCLDPGVVNTEMIDKINYVIIRKVLHLLKSFFKSPYEGAQTSIYLAVSPEVATVSGCYFQDCHLTTLNPKAQSLDVARTLWDVSKKAVNLE